MNLIEITLLSELSTKPGGRITPAVPEGLTVSEAPPRTRIICCLASHKGRALVLKSCSS